MIILRSLKTAAIFVTCVTAFIGYLGAPTMFGVVLITSSIAATVKAYGLTAFVMSLGVNVVKKRTSQHKQKSF